MIPTDLRITPTNSADDSRGSVWGIEGNLLWVVLGGTLLSLLVLLVGVAAWEGPLLGSLALAAVPLGLATAYVLFKQRCPPGYDLDLLDFWLHGRGFGPSEPLCAAGDSDGNRRRAFPLAWGVRADHPRRQTLKLHPHAVMLNPVFLYLRVIDARHASFIRTQTHHNLT